MARRRIRPMPESEEQVDETPDADEDPFANIGDVQQYVQPDEMQDRWDTLAAVADEFTDWKPATEVLTKVRSVPTIFPMYDRATRVFGYPIERVNTVHGPSNHGKTAFSLGLLLSFLMKGHFANLIDAEMTTPGSWITQLFGRYTDHPAFFAKRPRNYEEVVDSVRRWAETIGNLREQGRIPKDTTGLTVVDSIRKLVPKALMAKIQKEGADGLGGRSGQLKAAMNQAWLDDLTPLLYHTGTSVLMIAREAEDPNASASDMKFDQAWKVGGGKGIIYDASLVMRVTRAGWVYPPGKKDETKGKPKKVLGERIKVSIWKTKVENKDAKHAVGYFHLSNGTVSPEGFDRSRDILEVATDYGIVEKKGSWYAYNGRNIAQGADKVVAYLNDQPELRDHIEEACRQEFKPDELVPMEYDEEEDE